jgi:3-oxoacyl-[acyl-carrier protein] reductase
MEYIKGAPITYSVTKAALNAFVRYYSKIIGPKGVRINAIAPGNIFFKGSTWEKKIKKKEKIVKKTLKDEVSLQKFGSTTDITGIIDYLINSNSNFINGSVFVVEGGQIRSF